MNTTNLETRQMSADEINELGADIAAFVENPTVTSCERHIVESGLTEALVTHGTAAFDGDHLVDSIAKCGWCHRSWCDRCDPAPAGGCHYCQGRGHSTRPVGE